MANTGRLSVRVYITKAELPLPGATVVVTQNAANGKYNLLSVQMTDSSGMIRPVEIAAPEAGNSTMPGEQPDPPFALCSVWAEHPDYVLLQADGVQIFPGVETMQDMEMLPLSEGQSSLQRRYVQGTTPQSL